jgi:hypothetical protein
MTLKFFGLWKILKFETSFDFLLVMEKKVVVVRRFDEFGGC